MKEKKWWRKMNKADSTIKMNVFFIFSRFLHLESHMPLNTNYEKVHKMLCSFVESA